MSKHSTCTMLVFMATILLLGASAPAFGEDLAEHSAGGEAPAADQPSPCEQSAPPRLIEFSFAEEFELAKPPLPRTCACSCGLPCDSDADCGLGGKCISGFTCCVAPPADQEEAPSSPGDPAAAAGEASAVA